MHFLFHRVETLPRLGWCAVIEKGKKEIQVFHGPWVEIGENFFVEGAWDGSFTETDLESSILMGSGARIVDDKVIFSTPSHVLDRIYVICSGVKLYVSNSMIFLLKKSGHQLDLNYVFYHTEIMSIRYGIKKYIKHIPCVNGNKIYFYCYCNIETNSELQIKEIEKVIPPKFTTFNSYKKFLIDCITKLKENANSEHRKIMYTPLVTISSGYDSPACAVLAKEIGCEDAVTVRDARQRGYYDAGTEIGKILGLKIKEYNRRDYMRQKGMPEAEFVAVGDLGQDLVWAPLEDDFCQKIIFTGYDGGGFWDRIISHISQEIVKGDSAGCSLTEFRLRVGFIHVPITLLGCVNLPLIYQISNSEEMRPWSIRKRYDRPIPRRIIEEKGIDRKLFAQRKKAITVLLNRDHSLKSQMKPESYSSFNKYYQQNKRKVPWIKYVFHKFLFRLYVLFYYADEFCSKIGLPINIPNIIPWKFKESPGKPSYLIHWGISKIENRYE